MEHTKFIDYRSVLDDDFLKKHDKMSLEILNYYVQLLKRYYFSFDQFEILNKKLNRTPDIVRGHANKNKTKIAEQMRNLKKYNYEIKKEFVRIYKIYDRAIQKHHKKDLDKNIYDDYINDISRLIINLTD